MLPPAEHDGFKKRTVTMAQWLHRAEYVSQCGLIQSAAATDGLAGCAQDECESADGSG